LFHYNIATISIMQTSIYVMQTSGFPSKKHGFTFGIGL
jgi:hypothetical protein